LENIVEKWLGAHDAYWWVWSHPKLQFEGCVGAWIDIAPYKVDPETRFVEKDSTRNTHIEFWVEAGSYTRYEDEGILPSHNYDLDCGGDTWEEAVLNLAKLVLLKYGDYNE
jgi:hypothetical protein